MVEGSAILELAKRHAEAIAMRWYDAVLAEYPEQTYAAWKRESDRFANPVGHSLKAGARTVLDAVLDGADADILRAAVADIVRIRAVQQMSPSAAVGFVFRLKDAIRAELGDELRDGGLQDEMTELEQRVDAAALAAFDVYAEQRERVSELRINELKRNIPWATGRTSRGAVEPG
jgi:hypothetical protein